MRERHLPSSPFAQATFAQFKMSASSMVGQEGVSAKDGKRLQTWPGVDANMIMKAFRKFALEQKLSATLAFQALL